MIKNLTPHAIIIYPADAPDVIANASDIAPLRVIPRGFDIARVAEVVLDEWTIGGCPAVALRQESDVDLPPDNGSDWYVVSRPVAQVVGARRRDLLVPYREVRNTAGAPIGCRGFARIVVGEELPLWPALPTPNGAPCTSSSVLPAS